MGYSSKSHWSKYLGGTPVSDSLLGIKYILTLKDNEMNDVYGEPVYVDEEHETAVYETSTRSRSAIWFQAISSILISPTSSRRLSA